MSEEMQAGKNDDLLNNTVSPKGRSVLALIKNVPLVAAQSFWSY